MMTISTTKKYVLSIFCILFANVIYAQSLDTAAIINYIQQYKDIAISEMNRTGIPASITLAQGVHESGFGKSYLAQNTNNHFGIKCKEEWKGKTFKYTDDAPNECFRVYDNVEESYKDHSDFLKNRPRYASLFLLDKTDYKGWSYGLKKAGYATNPKYPVILIKLIEDFQLYAFDNNEMPSYLQTASNNTKIETKETTKEEHKQPHHTKPTKETEETEKSINKVETIIINENKQPTVSSKLNKKITIINKCKSIKMYPSKGETLDLIASTYKIEKADLLSYNDLKNDMQLKDGEIIYLQKKKKSNKEKTYKVKQEDDMWSISQKKGIQLPALLKLNKLNEKEEPAPKQSIKLKGKNKEKPALRTVTVEPKEIKKDEKISNEKSKKKNQVVEDETSENIVRARDTIYPTIKEATKLSVDSNKVLGWESETKLLEKTTVEETKKSIQLENKPTPIDIENVVVEVKPKTIKIEDQPIVSTDEPTKNLTNYHTVVKGDTMYNISKRYNITIDQLKEWNNMAETNIQLGQNLKIQP